MTTVGSSRQSCGGDALASPGGTYRKSLARGRPFFNRFDRWSKTGRWDRLFAALQTDIDPEWQSIDSTTNRAHQHAAGGKGGLLRRESAGHEEEQRPRSI